MNKFMNKKFLLSILAISIVPFSSNAATVYSKDGTSLDVFGSVSAMAMTDKAARTIKSSTEKKNSDNTLLTSVHAGIAGRSKITDGLYTLAYSEWLMPTGNNGVDTFKARSQYVGVDALELGTLTFGRGDNAYYAVAGVTDVFTELDPRVNDHYAYGDQMPSLIMYSLSSMSWDLRLSFQTASDDINDNKVNIHNGAAFSVATRLKSGISVSYGMSYYDFQYNQDQESVAAFAPIVNKMHFKSLNDTFSANLFKPSWKIDKGVSISYGTFGEGLYAGANFTVSKYDNFTHKLYSVDTVVNYTFDNGLGFSAGYGIKRFNGANIIADVELGAYYQVCPTFKVFAEGTIDASSKPDRFFSKSLIEDLSLDKNRALIGAMYSY